MIAQKNKTVIKITNSRKPDLELIKQLKNERINIIAQITIRCAEQYLIVKNTAADGSR